jgi:hypothetical protein
LNKLQRREKKEKQSRKNVNQRRNRVMREAGIDVGTAGPRSVRKDYGPHNNGRNANEDQQDNTGPHGLRPKSTWCAD